MSEHTPGPWFGDGEPFEGGILIYKQDGPADLGMAFTADNRDIAETRANARLFAAAPDLLEALEWALAELNGQTRYDEDVADQQIENCYALARAAISSAKGEGVDRG